MTSVSDELFERALKAYAGALAVVDPIRIQFWDDRGLTMLQVRMLFLLLEEDGQCAGALAEAMRVPASTVTRLSDRLVGQGLIVRREDPEDRRMVRLYLTGEGRRTIGEISEACRAYMKKVLSRLDEERLHRLVEGLEELAQAATAVQHQEQLV